MLDLPITAKYADYIPVFEDRKRTAAQRAGLAYERAVVRRLQSLYEKVEHGPWLYYKTPKTSGVCQPDAHVWLKPNHLCIVECKLTWQRPARLKLLTFYGPIVQAIYPDVELSYLQVYKNYKKGCHKRILSLYELETIRPGDYRECRNLT